MEILHDRVAQRFEAWVDGLRCELDYRLDGERLLITHTGTPPALRGRGLAAALMQHTLEWLAPQALQLVPLCSYAQTYLARHRSWQRMLAPPEAQRLLNFWFGASGSALDEQPRAEWFRKDEAFDAEIRTRFGAALTQALTSPWSAAQARAASPWELLARIVLLDQLTRNSWRGQEAAYSGDAQALALALVLLDEGGDQWLPPLLRWFAYLPLEHAEDLALQQRSVQCFEALASEDARLAGALDFARRHLAVIERFGRFPHRNAALGRPSSEAEQRYLAEPGAGF